MAQPPIIGASSSTAHSRAINPLLTVLSLYRVCESVPGAPQAGAGVYSILPWGRSFWSGA